MPYTHIRPLGFGEVLDGAFALYRRHFVDFFLTALIPLAPFGIFYARLMADGAAFDPAAGDAMAGLAGAMSLVSMLIMLIVYGALTRQAAQAYTGSEVSIGDGFGYGLRKTVPLLLTTIASLIILIVVWMVLGMGVAFVVGALTVFSSVAAVLVGVVTGLAALVLSAALFASLFAVGTAVVIEGAGPVAAIRRSWRLARGARGRIAGILFVSWLITALASFGVMFALGFGQAIIDPDSMAQATTSQLYLQQAVSTLMGALTFPFSVVCMVLLYFDRRVRTEGYDIEAATEALATIA